MEKHHGIWDRPVSEIMNAPVETVRTHDSLHDVAHLFIEHHISAAVVVNEDGKPVGVITKTDLVRHDDQNDENKTPRKSDRAWMNGASNKSDVHISQDDAFVEYWMTPVIFSVKSKTSVTEIAGRMFKYGTHHIFVRGENPDQILGIVSSFDILRQVALQERPLV